MISELPFISIPAIISLFIGHNANPKRKRAERSDDTQCDEIKDDDIEEKDFAPPYVTLNSLKSFPPIKEEIIKEEIHFIKQAEGWFEEGVRNQNLKSYDKAMSYYSKALDVFTEKEYPYVFAAIQNNMGIIYRKRAIIENSKSYLYEALQVYQEAFEVYAKLGHTMELAMVQNNLGIIYQQLASSTGKERFLMNAIESFKEALAAYKIEEHPFEYASIYNNLGNVYEDLAKVVDEKKNLLNAAHAYQEALKIFNIAERSEEERLPVEYANIQQNVGEVYSRLAQIEGDRENISRAIESFNNALKVYTKNNHPKKYAIIQTQIGRVHLFSAGVCRENDLKAIPYYIRHRKGGHP